MMSGGDSIWLLGGGGHAKVVAAAFQAAGWRVVGAFDENPAMHGRRLLDIEILGDVPDEDWWRQEGHWGFVAIGANDVRKRWAAKLDHARWPAIVHPSAWVHSSARLGPGVLIGANAVIQPDARIGAHAIINTAAVVEHDCIVGDYCHIAPRVCLAGTVKVGEGAFLGVGVSVKPGLYVGAWSIVGSGSVVIQDVLAGTTVVGVPARVIKTTPSGERTAP